MDSERPPEGEMNPAGNGYRAPEPTAASFVRLAEAYRKEGLLEDAARICRNGLEQFPASWQGRIVLGRILLEQGAVEEASDALDRVRHEARGRPEILIALEEALKDAPTAGVERVESIEPDVLILDSSEDRAPERNLAGEASSGDPLASPTLAKLYQSQGDPAKAEAILRQIGQRDEPVGPREDSGGDRARQRYLRSLTAFRSVVQRERRTRLC